MTIYLPFFISFLIGCLVNRAILRKTKDVNFLLFLFLAVGVGLGFSSLLTFLSFLICDGFNPFFIFYANLSFLLILLVIDFIRKDSRAFFTKTNWFNISHFFYGAFFLIVLILVYIGAKNHPFGEWDGWAIWNMKAKFLTLSGDSWKDVFLRLHWHTQPDYPLLLPLINIWGWLLSGNDFYRSPILTSVIFTVSCGGLLFSGLTRYIDKTIALLASCLLLFLPFYVFIGTAQYADIVLAYYLLASLISLMIMIREKDNGFAVLFGLFLGFISFTKNEGIAISILLIAISILYLFSENRKSRFSNLKIIAFIFLGLVVTMTPAIIFKLFLAPPNRDIAITNGTISSPFFNLEGCYLIATAFMYEVLHKRWCYIWLLIIFAILLDIRKYFYKERKILVFFFLSYFVIVFFVYLTTVNFSLTWRLSRTLPRILLYLLPSVLFLVFYVFGYKENAKKNKI